jgi:hypothetical protein
MTGGVAGPERCPGSRPAPGGCASSRRQGTRSGPADRRGASMRSAARLPARPGAAAPARSSSALRTRGSRHPSPLLGPVRQSRERDFQAEPQRSSHVGSELLQPAGAGGVAQWCATRVQAHREAQTDNARDARRLDEGERGDAGRLDPTVAGAGQARRAGHLRLAQAKCHTGLTELVRQVAQDPRASSIAPSANPFRGRHRWSVTPAAYGPLIGDDRSMCATGTTGPRVALRAGLPARSGDQCATGEHVGRVPVGNRPVSGV